MSNKKKQRSARVVKVPAKFNDHVVGSLSQKRNETVTKDVTNEIRVHGIGKEAESDHRPVEKSGDGNDMNPVEVNTAEAQIVSNHENIYTPTDNDTGKHTVSNSVKDCDNNENDTTAEVCSTESVEVNGSVNEESGVKNTKEVNVKSTERNRKTNSYASVVMKEEIPKNLSYIPTVVNDSGNDVVVFDEMLVQKGSEKWCCTASGFFVGYNMNVNELRYNLGRMWRKYGIKEISASKDGHYLFKFRNVEGLNVVVEKGPWMVSNKPLFVQKWSPEVGMQKVEPKKLPVWVKMMHVPLEAWSIEGISALASSLGNPLVMDSMTAAMCHSGIGSLDFARVLIEMDAEKEFKSEIEIQYRDKENKVKGTKKVQVAYDWKPPACSHCKVFGHEKKNCKNSGNEQEVHNEQNIDLANKEKENGKNGGAGKNDLRKVNEADGAGVNRRGGNINQRQWINRFENNRTKNANVEFKPKANGNKEVVNDTNVVKNKEDRSGDAGGNSKTNYGGNNEQETAKEAPKSPNAIRNLDKESMKDIRISANKFSILDEISDSDLHRKSRMEDPNIILQCEKELKFIDKLVNDKRIPNVEESKLWFKSTNQLQYYKKKWEVKWKTGSPI